MVRVVGRSKLGLETEKQSSPVIGERPLSASLTPRIALHSQFLSNLSLNSHKRIGILMYID